MKRHGCGWRALAMYALCSSLCTQLAYAQDTPPPLALEQVQTRHVCDVIGLGAFDTVPYNFPGVPDTSTLRQVPPGFVALPEARLAAGANAQVPRVLAGDMGVPFQGSDGRLHFIFNDTISPPSNGVSACPDGVPCVPTTTNDDLLATSAAGPWQPGQSCLQLDIARGPVADEYEPITWLGPVSKGGRSLGPGIVPGPAFNTGRYTFMIVPDAPLPACSVKGQDCARISGVASDSCVGASSDGSSGTCHFGPCSAGADAPCALRLSPSTLAVRESGSNFVTPEVGVHVRSEKVLHAFRGHFSTVSFHAQLDGSQETGTIWVLGRDSYWGTAGLPMSPYLMRLPVEQGLVSEPEYFAGVGADGPRFSANADDAIPIYAETQPLNQHTSFIHVPAFAGGVWLMFYGGHAQPALRSTIAQFVRPAVDSLFYGKDNGVYARWAREPWGPWSDPVTVFNPYLSDSGGYCEQMFFDDPQGISGFSCPAERAAHNRSLNRVPSAGMAGEYGAALLPGYAESAADGQSLTVRWLLSTWNPYRVILLETELRQAVDYAGFVASRAGWHTAAQAHGRRKL